MDKFIPSALLIADGGGGIGSGRLVPTVAALVGLIGVVLGGVALTRSARRVGTGRLGHSANSAGGFGTGNGLAGAIVAMVVGLISIVLCGLALRRTGR
jgi:hypothetical protein